MATLAAWLDALRQITPVQIKEYYWAAQDIYLSPWLYVMLGAILVMERLRPAVPNQPLLSGSVFEDFLWFNLDWIISVALLPGYIGLLQMGVESVTGGSTVLVMTAWPLAGRVGLSFVIFDFIQWFHHWVRHKVPAFWHFHVIHHSQRELNVFTDLRVHWAEDFINSAIAFPIVFALGLEPFVIVAVNFVRVWHTRLIHANIRASFGPLGHVLVSPQFHRIHHSIEARHQDKNFGVMLTVWDRIFGTMWRGHDDYPPTGVEGVDFPPPRSYSPAAWGRHILGQFLYPFRHLGQKRRATG